MSQLPFLRFETSIEKNTDESLKETNNLSELKTNADFEWVLIPTVSSRYFSPDTSPGIGDSILYSFAVNQAKNYTLNISAYYDPIENYGGTIGLGESLYSAAYLMPNNTWLVVGLEYRLDVMEAWMVLGIGTNASNFEWHTVGQVNTTDTMAVAGDESGKIRIVYFEEIGLDTAFRGINYFASNDWGQSWTNDTLINYMDCSASQIYGITIAAYKGNFTSMWGGALNASIDMSGDISKNSTIVEVEERAGVWTTPANLSALGPRLGCKNPQVFFNRTRNNGTLMLAYDYYLNPKISATQKMALIQLGNGLHSAATANWSISFENNLISDNEKPIVYCTKDNSTEVFYFVERNPNTMEGMRNATWGDPDVISRPIDLFQTEAKNCFNIYANNGPQCFTSYARAGQGDRIPGILDCKTPFNVRKTKAETQAYEIISYLFNGRDENGNSREAQAYSFNIHIGSTDSGFNNLVVYVDDIPASVNCMPPINRISPFTSPGVNDNFTLYIEADKAGTATLNIKAIMPIFGQEVISKGLSDVYYPSLCGDGINNYLFFTNMEDPISMLMFAKSSDGGLSWTDPKIIDSSISFSYLKKSAIFTGTEIFLWTDNRSLFSSSDYGTTFIKHAQETEVQAVTSDLLCWTFFINNSNQLVFNKSTDFGYNWETFCTINNENATKYRFQDAAYDPISKNYSFLIAHINKPEVLYLTAINNGSKVSISKNILEDGRNAEKYTSMVDLENRWVNESSTKWIVTTCAKNILSTQTLTSNLSYCVSDGNLNFSDWQNFTDANGNGMPAFVFWGKNWDIFFPENGEPCYVTGVKGPGFFPTSLKITSSSKLVFDTSKELDENHEAELNFYGVTGNGEILADGNYTWTSEVIDRAGYKIIDTGTLLVDNSDPSIYIDPILSPANPYPTNNVNITVTVYEANPDKGFLYYLIPGGTWNILPMYMNDTHGPYINFTRTIPAQSTDTTRVDWKILITDLCGNILDIDNNGQLYSYARPVYEYVKESGVLKPTLYDDWMWSYVFTSGNEHLDEVLVRMEFDGDASQFENKIDASGESGNIFSIQINHTLKYSSAVYKFMFKTDIGQIYTIEEIALETPGIRIEEEEEPPETIDLNELQNLTVSFLIPEYDNYIDHVYIDYKFDDGKGSQIERLEGTGSFYKYVFKDFPANATKLNYTVIAVDIYDNKISLAKARSINILPKLPTLEMNAMQQFIVSIIALFVGIASGLLYSEIMSSKKTDRALYEEVLKVSKKISLEKTMAGKSKKKNSNPKEINAIKRKKNLMIGITGIGFSACIGLAIISMLVYQSAEIAMLLFTGAFALSIALWVLLSARSADKILRSEEANITMRKKFLLTSFSILIYLILLAIFFAGNTIPWWRVRVNQQSYQILDLSIPKALTTVTTAFFSSVLLLTWSTFKQISSRAEELQKAKINNDNPLTVIERRERAISTVINNVGTKGIIFIAIIGIVIVFASDLNVYASQAVLIAIPFVIGAISTLAIMAYFQWKKQKPIETLVLDYLITCPQCRKKTALGGNFCEQCGKKLLTGQRSSKGFTCNTCKQYNTLGTKHCRYCGALLEANDGEILQQDINNTLEHPNNKTDFPNDKKTSKK